MLRHLTLVRLHKENRDSFGVVVTLVTDGPTMVQHLTREELPRLLVRLREAVQDKALVFTWVGHQLVLHHFH